MEGDGEMERERDGRDRQADKIKRGRGGRERGGERGGERETQRERETDRQTQT